MRDIYSNTEWTEMDVEDLKAAMEHGTSIEEIAEFLCRSDTIEDVRRKCAELGLEISNKKARQP